MPPSFRRGFLRDFRGSQDYSAGATASYRDGTGRAPPGDT